VVCFPLAPAALPVFVALPLMQALQILDVFWSQHDPTRNSSSRQYAPNSQLPPPPTRHPLPITHFPHGCGRYMYAIFYSNAEQQAAAAASAALVEKKRGKIATHILPRTTVSALFFRVRGTAFW
jgi:hypothetical protein